MWKGTKSELRLILLVLIISRISCILSQDVDNLLTNEDEFILEGSESEIPLETFFWTGSGDGPPLLQPPPRPITTLNRDMFVKTSTVMATVYVGQSPMDEDPLCVYNCDTPPRSEEQTLRNETIALSRSDRRFWLLTVVSGFFQVTDIPLLEGHLAKIYRNAFVRQQAYHLGISTVVVNNITIEGEDRQQRRIRKKRNATSNEEYLKLIRPTRTLEPDEKRTKDQMPRSDFKMTANRWPSLETVRVIIHNMTHLSAEDVQMRNMDNQVDFIDPTKSSIPSSSVNLSQNQTEFLYTVFVGNKPVLAVTAAEDMKLVTTDEMVKTLGSQVYTKSEPYLKEPLATPLIPATATIQKNTNILHYAMENPIMFGMLCASVFLLIFLFVGFLLMAKTKRAHSAEIRRLTSERNKRRDPERRPIPNLPTEGDLKHGNDNPAFETDDNHDGTKRHSKSRPRLAHDKPPDIHFPLPPLHRPSSGSSDTSDSSVYYHKRYRDEAETIAKDHLGEMPMFHKSQRHSTNDGDNDDPDRIYAIVAKGSHDGRHKKTKYKKKYLHENRVGSVEHSKAIIEVLSSPASQGSSEVTYAAPDNYDQMDNFNLKTAESVHDRRSQQLKQALYGEGEDFEIASSVMNSPNEAINREILKALQDGSEHTSADSGSIGSFLSMASLKSFPKCAVPEPLSRVLEPVTITHYDQEDRKILKPSSTSATYKKQVIEHFVTNEKRVNISVQEKDIFKRTQSDGSDPGVVGPIVWEMHKKEVGKQNSPLKDPVKTRSRFEGLIEGAISLYETSEDRELGHSRKPAVSFSRNSENNRGKSAVVTGMRPKMGILRPVTAMTTNNIRDGTFSPPTPSKGAWRSAAASPHVRPLSAGPFHRPEVSINSNPIAAPKSDALVQLSTAPLIEAIQNELKKFNRNSSSNNNN